MDDLFTKFAKAKDFLHGISRLSIDFKEIFNITILCSFAVAVLIYTIIIYFLAN